MKLFRMSTMTITTAVLVAAVYVLAKQQIGVLLFKACLMTLAAALGYMIDRELFPLSRPHMVSDYNLRWRYEWRRALIVAATLLTAGLGS